VRYGALSELGIDEAELHFVPMPEPEIVEEKVKPLTIREAKAGLAAMFGVTTSDIEITIRS
jgi:hypothetical protein